MTERCGANFQSPQPREAILSQALELRTCYNCRERFYLPDFFLLVANERGVWLHEDLDESQIEETDEIIEVERCPHCLAEL